MSQTKLANDLSVYMSIELSSHLGESSDQKKPTIPKVLDSIRQVCPDAYEPKLISIGPLHRNKPELKKMDHLKWKYLNDLMERSISGISYRFPPQMRLADFIKAMCQLQEDVRKQYSVDIGMGVGKLVQMLVLDGCFLIELFIKRATDPMGLAWEDAKWNLPMLRDDLLLLENQIPFSVLEALFRRAFPRGLPRQDPVTQDGTPPPPLGILDLALHYISWGREEVKDLGKQSHEIHHLLHLNHIWTLLHFRPTPRQSSNTRFFESTKKIIRGSLVNCLFFFVSLILMCKTPRRHAWERVRFQRGISSAKNLKEAGIKFKDKTFNRCCLNISFHEESGNLEVPFLYLDQNSNSSFRNLIALEQCHIEGIQTHFSAYATFMDNIIDTAEDVEILVRHGIIESKLGSNEDVASLFNNLCKGATLNYEQHYLADLFKRVNAYCDSDRHRWSALLVNNYFDNPWSGASVIAAIILLFLTLGATIATILQTIYAVKSYQKQF